MKAEKAPAAAKEPAPGDKKRPRAPTVKATPAAEVPAAPGKKAVKRAAVAKKTAAPAKKAVTKAVTKAAAPRKAPARAAELVVEAAPAVKKPAAKKRVQAEASAPEVPAPEVEVLPPLDAVAANDAAVAADILSGTTTITAVVEMVVIEDDATRRHRIAVEAYLIAESRGFPAGLDELHWLEAERKLYGK